MSDSKQHGKRRKALREAVQGVTGPLSGSDRSGRGSSHRARGFSPDTDGSAYPQHPHYGDGPGTWEQYHEQTGPGSHAQGVTYQDPSTRYGLHQQSSQTPGRYDFSSYETESHWYSGQNQDQSRLFPPHAPASSHGFASPHERVSQSVANSQGQEPRIVVINGEKYLVTEEIAMSVQYSSTEITVGPSSDPNAVHVASQESMRRAQEQMQQMLSSGNAGRLSPSVLQRPHSTQSQQSSSPHPAPYSNNGQQPYSTHSQQSASSHLCPSSFGSQGVQSSYSHQPPHQIYSGFDTPPPQAHPHSPYPADPPPRYEQATGGSQYGTNSSAQQPEEYQYGPGQGSPYGRGGGSNYGEGNSGDYGNQHGGTAAHTSYGGSSAGGYGTEGGYGGGGGSDYANQQNQYGSEYGSSGGGYGGGYGDKKEDDTWARFAEGNGGGYV